jgi:hypothetical protein
MSRSRDGDTDLGTIRPEKGRATAHFYHHERHETQENEVPEAFVSFFVSFVVISLP